MGNFLWFIIGIIVGVYIAGHEPSLQHAGGRGPEPRPAPIVRPVEPPPTPQVDPTPNAPPPRVNNAPDDVVGQVCGAYLDWEKGAHKMIPGVAHYCRGQL